MRAESFVIQEQTPSEKALITSAQNLLSLYQERPITVGQLIKAAGISKAVFYRYFANIDDVYAAILLHDELQVTPLLRQLRVYGTVADLLEQLLKFRIQQFEKCRILAGLEQQLAAKNCELARFQQWQGLRRQHVEEFTSIVASKSVRLTVADRENLRFYYGLVWSISAGVAQLANNDFFHEMVQDRRGFTRFLLESMALVGEDKG